jgi:hypothetical protein
VPQLRRKTHLSIWGVYRGSAGTVLAAGRGIALGSPAQ